MTDGPIVEIGRVAARSGDIIEIEIAETADCRGCGLCVLAQGGAMRVEVRAAGTIAVGQRVRVTFPYRSRWQAIAVVFAIPLALFFAAGISTGAVAQSLSWPASAGGVAAIAAAFAGLAGGLLIGMWNNRRFKGRLLQRTIVEPLEEPQARQ